MPAAVRRGGVVVILVIGLGLIAAPALFQMFSRAPQGAEMIDEFRPFMTADQVVLFRGYLDTIDAADAESRLGLRADVVESGGVASDGEYPERFASVVALNDDWPGIQADMGDLLDRMEANLGNYRAVDALPEFTLFPWFFVLPGVVVAGLAIAVLRLGRDSPWRRRLLWALVGMGVAIAAAPAVFQMFSRAPQGAEMIDDFRPMMTTERVQNVQGYFISMGAAESQLRNQVLPLAPDAGDYPAIATFSQEWPTIVTDFGPMVSAMNDNVDNFAAVDALPNFALFPWFFVIPGILIAVLAFRALRSPRPEPAAPVAADSGGENP